MMWNWVYADIFFPLSGWVSRFDTAFQVPQPCFLFSTSKQLLCKMSYRLWENQPPILGKAGSVLGRNRLGFSRKSATDFWEICREEICHRI